MINIVNISKSYIDGTIENEVLNDISFSIDEGEFVIIMGASGSGKSTLANIIGGIILPSQGYVNFGDVKINNLSEDERSILRREEIGFIYQDFNLLPVLNVNENIKFQANIAGKTVDEDYFEEIINILDISDKLNMMPSKLSGGERQRVCIARAVMANPRLIIADEPTGNLDSENSKMVLELLKKTIQISGCSLFMITHNEDLVVYGDKLLRIRDGEIS